MSRVANRMSMFGILVTGLVMATAVVAATPDEQQSTLGSNWPAA